jgi:hypothetical protein
MLYFNNPCDYYLHFAKKMYFALVIGSSSTQLKDGCFALVQG